MNEFIYCPKCGARLGKSVIGDEGEVPFCADCKQPYFIQFPACVIVVVIDENNRVILLKQKHVSATNHVLVAGYIKYGDNAEETVVNEVAEETGQCVLDIKYFRSYFYEKRGMLMFGYAVFVKAQDFVESVEVDEVEWFDLGTAISLVRQGSIAEQHLLSVAAWLKKRSDQPLKGEGNR